MVSKKLLKGTKEHQTNGNHPIQPSTLFFGTCQKFLRGNHTSLQLAYKGPGVQAVLLSSSDADHPSLLYRSLSDYTNMDAVCSQAHIHTRTIHRRIIGLNLHR